jgi:hypothetical protein
MKKPMRLPVAARNALKRELRNHPEIRQHVSLIAEISQLRKEELLTLAKKLSINVNGLIKEEVKLTSNPENVGNPEEYLEAVFEPEEIDLFHYQNKHPAFEGTLEFELKLEAFGKSTTRKARVVWQHTPEWEHYDLNRHCVMPAGGQFVLYTEILAVSEREYWDRGADGKSRKRKNMPTWTKIDLLKEDALMSDEMLQEIDARIDQACRVEDAARRAKLASGAQVPVRN